MPLKMWMCGTTLQLNISLSKALLMLRGSRPWFFFLLCSFIWLQLLVTCLSSSWCAWMLVFTPQCTFSWATYHSLMCFAWLSLFIKSFCLTCLEIKLFLLPTACHKCTSFLLWHAASSLYWQPWVMTVTLPFATPCSTTSSWTAEFVFSWPSFVGFWVL